MRGRGRATALAAAIAALLSMAAASAPAKVAPPPHPMAAKSLFGQQVVPGEVIVRYEQGASRSERAEASEAVDANFERRLLLPRTELVEVPKGAEQEVAAQLERDPNVLYAEPNAIVREMATPNDTRFTSLWGLKNTGQHVNHVAGAADADIDATEGWSLGAGLGSSLRVAVVDSGVVANHPDLAANMFINPGENGSGQRTNGVDDDGNGKIDDFRGWDFAQNDNNPTTNRDHGTHVAGTIAARSNNNLGVAGAGSFPAAGSWRGPRILAVKVLDEQGMGTVAAVADGLMYAGTMNAKVANASIGFEGTSAALDDAIKSNPGTLYVVAAGNNGSNNDTNPRSPCNPATTPDAPNKLCVGATGPRDALAGFSNFGAVNVDLAAPGVNILSTVPTKTIFRDDFETSIPDRWKNDDAGQSGNRVWRGTTLFSTSPTHSLTDSTGGTAADPTQYVANQDNWARNRTGFDLTGGSGCKLTAQVKIDTEDNFDWFTIEATRTPGAAASWQELFAFSGAGTGSVTADLSAFDNRTGIFVRFRLDSDSSRQDDGAYVDDVAVTCRMTGFDATSYAFLSGTSMASAQVAGAAAFLFTKLPTATVAQIKDKLLRGADRKASLAGDVRTGARLNLYKAAAESTAAVAGGVLTFTAEAGQKNNVTVTRFTDTDSIAKYRITDPYSTSATAQQSGSRIQPGAGCTRVNNTTVTCPVAGITGIVLNGGDGNDTLNASAIAIPVTLNGGKGSDNLTGGTGADTLTGGPGGDRFTARPGNDTIRARHQDVDAGFTCGENAGDSDTVQADLSPNDPVTARATNCEVVNKQ